MRKTALILALIAALLVPAQAQAATAKAGATCTKLKATQVVGTKKFTCIKSGKKLVWDKGVAVVPVFVKKPQEIIVPELKNVFLDNKFVQLPQILTTGNQIVSLSGSGACSYDSVTKQFKLISIGTCTVTMSQTGDPNLLPAPNVTKSFEILKIPQLLPPFSIPDQDLLTSKEVSISYPDFGSSAPVTVTNKSPEVCTIDGAGKRISFLAVGQCNLTFNKAGDAEYEAAKPAEISFKIFLSAKPGDKANPAGLGVEIIKAGVSVTVDAINEEVGDDVCLADSANKSCADKNGSGVFQSIANDRYVEIVFTIVNNGTKTWIASNIGMQVGSDQNYLKTTVYTIDSLDGLELEPGDGITGSYFVLLPNSADSARTLISYGDGNEATTFYFKAN